jgi:hypothetical protein
MATFWATVSYTVVAFVVLAAVWAFAIAPWYVPTHSRR